MAISRIDTEKCVGCGACVNSCAMDVIRFDSSLSDSETFTPCRMACPAGVNIRHYISLLTQGKLDEAIKVIREALPLPAVTGHVCFHPCEKECARKEVDEAVNINALERFVADYWLEERAKPVHRRYMKKVAIIGSGPAGLAAAYDLVRMGYPVTVFESQPALGGMLRFGIPEYRLPEKVLDAQIDYIGGLGVEFKTGVTFGKDLNLDRLRKNGYQALLIAIGAQLSRQLDIEGAQMSDVLWGLDFLRDVKFGKDVRVKDRVVVVGGGNVAMDTALTARRLGAKEVRIFCLEDWEEMPAHEETISMALEEGIGIDVSWGPKEIVGRDGDVTGIQLVRCLSVFDKKGDLNPDFDNKKTRSVETDMVIFAVGENIDLTGLPKGINTDGDRIGVDPATLETNLPGVFSAGVAVSGPGSVIEAIASGKKAAVSIDRYLGGKDLRLGREVDVNIVEKPPRESVEKRPRQATLLISVDRRKQGFEEIKIGFNEKIAEREVSRCMACGSKVSIRYLEDCMTCYSCERDCPESAIYVLPEHIPPGVSSWG